MKYCDRETVSDNLNNWSHVADGHCLGPSHTAHSQFGKEWSHSSCSSCPKSDRMGGKGRTLVHDCPQGVLAPNRQGKVLKLMAVPVTTGPAGIAAGSAIAFATTVSLHGHSDLVMQFIIPILQMRPQLRSLVTSPRAQSWPVAQRRSKPVSL